MSVDSMEKGIEDVEKSKYHSTFGLDHISSARRVADALD